MEENILSENDKKRIRLLEEQLSTKSEEIEHLRKQLSAKERLFDNSEKINQDLRDQIRFLSTRIQSYENAKGPRVHSSSQTDISGKATFTDRNNSIEYHPSLTKQLSGSTKSISPPLLTRSSLESLTADSKLIQAGIKSKLSISIDNISTTSQRHDKKAISIDDPNTSNLAKTNSWKKESENTQTRISDLVRDCVEQSISSSSSVDEAVQEDDYIYDEKTRTYYSPSTQLFWYPDTSYFYDPRSSSYYHYDSARKSLQFHSTLKLDQPSLASNANSSELEALSRAQIVSGAFRNASNSTDPTIMIKDSISSGEPLIKYSTTTAADESDHQIFPIDDEDNNHYLANGIGNRFSLAPMHKIDEAESEPDMQPGKVFACIENNNEQLQKLTPKSPSVSPHADELEEGEITDSDSNSSYRVEEAKPITELIQPSSRQTFTNNADCLRYNGPDDQEQAISETDTPCVRMIVNRSQTLEIGSLLLITPKGGTIGRLPRCQVCIPDDGIENNHCTMYYSKITGSYLLEGLTREGSTIIVHGEDQSNSHTVLISEKIPLFHGAILKLGFDTQLLIHIHPGRDITCNYCEPGVVQHRLKTEQAKMKKEIDLSANNKGKEASRRAILNALKRKYGINSSALNDDVIEVPQPSKEGNFDRIDANNPSKKLYRDRAAERRSTRIGSINPYEKTDLTVGQKALGPKNKGYKILSKMGWAEGQRLGTDSTNEFNLLEPLIVTGNFGTTGLGSSATSYNAGPQLHSKGYNEKDRIDDDFNP